MKKKIGFFFCLLMLVVSVSYADTIVLKSTQQVEGKIIEKTEKLIKIDVNGVEVTYYTDEIETVNGQNFSPAAMPQQTEGTTIGAVTNITTPTTTEGVNAAEAITTPEISVSETTPTTETVLAPETIPQVTPITETQLPETTPEAGQPGEILASHQDPEVKITQTLSPPEVTQDGAGVENVLQPEDALATVGPVTPGNRKLTPEQRKIAAAVATGMILAFVFIVFILYVYSSICLYFIAKKTEVPLAWMAWIPIANLFLMCKIANLKYWWLLLVIPCFIPVIGTVFSFGLFGFLWYKIALARNKPGWIGIITVVPLLGLFTMGYLAFSQE